MKVSVIRKNVMFMPDSSRVVARFFMSGDQRTQELVGRILMGCRLTMLSCQMNEKCS